MKASDEILFKNVLQDFYQKATQNHSIKYALKNKLKTVFNNIRKEWLLNHETESRSTISKTQTSSKKENPIHEFASLRLTPQNTSQQKTNLSVSRSRSRWSKSSSKDLSDNESKHFNCEWIYQSGEKTHTLLFAIMSALIVTDNKFSFKYYQDKINDELSEAQIFSELEFGIIGNYWQKMGGLLARSKTVRWQKLLKEAIDKFPIKFTELACRIILKLEHKEEPFSDEVIDRMSKQLKIQTTFFTICYRDIEHISPLGKHGPQLYLGQLSHSKLYVISSKIPEYSQEELKNRTIRNNFNVVTTSLLKDFNSKRFLEYQNLADNYKEKENIVKEHFKAKLVGLEGE